MTRITPDNLRAAWWAVRTARRTRRVLEAKGLDAALAPPPPPPLPSEAGRGVRGALRRYGESCLVNAIVQQTWEAAHGRRRDLVVGITQPGDFSAHAWLEGDPVHTTDDVARDDSVPANQATAPDGSNHRGGAEDGDAPTVFAQLLRRPAPYYSRDLPDAGRLSGPPTFWYRIHGFLVESEIPFNGQSVAGDVAALRPAPGGTEGASPDYRVIEGEPRECPHSPPPGRILGEFREQGLAYWATETRREPPRWTLRYGGICDVTLDGGAHTITVHRASEADPGMLPIFLEGSVLAHAATAEGLLILHASAIEVDGRALAIVGPPGAGKSTLAAMLCAVGGSLVADDALRVDATGNGAVCFPGTRGIRLRPAAANLTAEIESAAVETTADGRTAVFPARRVEAPLELEAILIPDLSRQATKVDLRRLGAMEGLKELLGYPRLTMWRAPEPIASLFELTARVAADVPVYRATLPWGPPFQSGLAERLLASLELGAPPDSAHPRARPLDAGREVQS